jgi:hypothetical protein
LQITVLYEAVKIKENKMKRNVFLIAVLIVFANTAVFSQNPVKVPDNFVGTWWYDFSFSIFAEELNESGIQWLWSIEIKKDGTWIWSHKTTAYNQDGLQFLKEKGWTNPYSLIMNSGYVTAATSVGIIELTKFGENTLFGSLLFDGDGIETSLSLLGVRYTKKEPPLPKQ